MTQNDKYLKLLRYLWQKLNFSETFARIFHFMLPTSPNYKQQASQYLQEAEQEANRANYSLSNELLDKVFSFFEQSEMWAEWAEAQNMKGVNYFCLDEINKGVDLFNKVNALPTRLLPKQHKSRIEALSNLGSCFKKQLLFIEALAHYHQAIELSELNPGIGDEDVATIYNNIGVCYAEKGDAEKAVKYLQKAVKTAENLTDPDTKNITLAIVFNSLGNYYTRYGDYVQALHCFHKTLGIELNYLPENHPDTARSYNNIANILWKQQEYQEALSNFQKARTIFQLKLGSSHPFVASAFTNMAYCHLQLKDYPEAKACLDKYWDINAAKTPLDKAKAHFHFSDYHAFQQQYTQAVEHCEKGLAIASKVIGKTHPRLVIYYIKLADCQVHLQKYEDAIQMYHLALQCIEQDFTTSDIYQTPTLTAVSQQYASQLLDALSGKANAFFKLYRYRTYNHKDLQTAHRIYSTAMQLSQKIQLSYLAEGSKLMLSAKKQTLFDEAIDTTWTLYKEFPPTNTKVLAEFAFTISEESKSSILYSSLRETQAKLAADIPAQLIEQEKQLKIELNYLDNAIAREENTGSKKDKKRLLQYQGQYFDFKQQYDRLITRFEKEYPQYFQLKYKVDTATVSQIQNQLAAGTLLLDFFVGKQHIYLFAIHKKGFQIHQIVKPDHFGQLIQSFRQAMEWMDEYQFTETGYKLYQLLLSPVFENYPPLKGAGGIKNPIFFTTFTNLLIIPHGELRYLPFEALIVQPPETKNTAFHQLSYLIQSFSVTYHYSATLWLNGVHRHSVTAALPDSFLGVAPVTFDGSSNKELAIESSQRTGYKNKVFRSSSANTSTFEQLPSTETEVKAVYTLFQQYQKASKALLFGAASKQNLQHYAPRHKYILISTHGFIQDGKAKLSGIQLAKPKKEHSKSESGSPYSYIQIDDSKDHHLYISEAYHLQLHADLVVLSSCESGMGELAVGEGIMALNRGFLYAGASNIIFSLFEVPDDATGKLIPLIFEDILKGETYANALRKAKTSLIIDEEFSPQDWAGMVLIGC